MKCYSCKKELPEGSVFCPYCGEKQGFDRQTLDAAIAGDQDALADLYSRTYDSVYYTVRAMIRDEDTVLDLVQDSFVKAFQYLDRLQDPNKFRPWVKRIAHNLAVDYTRRNRPTLFSEMADEESELILDFEDDRPESLPEVMLDRKESARLIREILGELSEDQRLVVAIYYYEQRSVRDIAAELGLSENTVKSRLFQSRKKIETRVRALEAQGTRLYSLSPVAFLLLLLRNQEQFLPPIPADLMLDSVTRELAAHAMRSGPAVSKGVARAAAETARSSKQAADAVHSARTGAAVSKRAVEAAGHSVAHSIGSAVGATAAKGAAVKVAALVTAAAVVVGGGAYAVHEVVRQRQPEPAAIVEPLYPGTQPDTAVIIPAEPGSIFAPDPQTEPLTMDHMETLHNLEMAVEYPVFRGEKSEEVNALILARAEELSCINNPYYTQEQLSGEYKAAVMLLNDRVLSVAFWGWSYVEGGIHPFSNLFPLNLDLETMDTFTLSDLYDVEDPSFVSLCYANGRFPGSPETCFSEEDYPNAFAYERDEYHALRFTEDGFLKPEGAVFTFPFMHATGSDHMEILVPYEALSSLYRGPYDLEELSGNREQSPALSAELRQAYLAKLRERERDIRYYAGKYGNTDGVCVAICDVAGDDTPELLFITSQEGAGGDFLWIYGYEAGELKELARIAWTPEADVVSMHCLYQQSGIKRPVAEASGQNNSGYWHTDLYYFPLEEGRLVQKRLAWSEGYNSGYTPVYDFDGLRLSEAEYDLNLSEFRADACRVLLYDVRWGVDGRDALGLAELPCAALRYDEAIQVLIR